MLRVLVIIALLSASLAGCGRKQANDEPTSTPQPPDLAGVYAGSFACGNCKEISQTLWVRGDGRFFLRQSYLSEDGKVEDASYAFGLWSWDENAAELVLRGHGPERRLKRLDGDRLEQLAAVASAAKSVLTREANAPAFTDRVRLDGESAMSERSATFKQCVTGLELAIVNNDSLKELRRLHKALNPTHRVALTAIDAHIVAAGAAAGEQLVIDKVIAIKPGSGC
jgi:hypothetical protein